MSCMTRLALLVAVWMASPAWGPDARTVGVRPVVGAIRWDAWVGGSEWEKNLSPKQWNARLPFYSRVVSEDKVEIRGNIQEVVDREIAYASGAGLDYWAFCYSHPTDSERGQDAYGLRLYLSSSRKADLHFCLLLMAQGYWGPKEDYPKAIAAFVEYFKQPTYQTVLGGRPLVYFFYVEAMQGYFGSEAAVREALELLRRKTTEAGLPPPYLVAQVFDARSGAHYVDQYGFDAISAYACVGPGHRDQEYPYGALAEANRSFWEACRATGKQVIPLVSAGWDNRPRWADAKRYQELYKGPPRGPWYQQPTPQELAANLKAAMQWNAEHRDQAQANAVLIYAWNESDEGGWLVPTLSEGTARLDALRPALRPAHFE